MLKGTATQTPQVIKFILQVLHYVEKPETYISTTIINGVQETQ